jgi:serine protease Do
LPSLPDVRTIVRERGPAVVRVEAREAALPGLVRRVGRLLNPFPLRDTLGEAVSLVLFLPAIAVPSMRKHIGSGVLIDPEGHLLTNAHVIEDADRVNVELTDAQEVPRVFRARIVGRDRLSDVALLRIAPEKVPLVVAPLGSSDELARGDWVVVIGNPLNLTGSVSVGVVSGLHRQVGAHELEDHLQVEAALNPGNSGGPILNTRGEVVGLVSLGVVPSNGIGFAVPTGLIRPWLEDLKADGRPHRGCLGATLRDLTPHLAKKEGLDVETGVLVTDTAWLGPADRAGIEPGDLLITYAGQPAKKAREVRAAVLQTRPGTTVDVEVRRERKSIACQVKVGERRRPFRLL